MRKVTILLIFILLFVWRWEGMASPLPAKWTPDSVVRVTVPIVDFPEHTDTSTIVRSGVWYIPLPGYVEIIPGDLVAFSGQAEPQFLVGKIMRVMMKGTRFEVVKPKVARKLNLGETILIDLHKITQYLVGELGRWMPEPMSSLAIGILLGVKGQMPSDFYNSLVNTGTLHIIAASGYNVSIVLEVLMQGAIMLVTRGWAIGIGIVGVVTYVLLAGAGASVLRAGIMGSLTIVAYYFGRPTEARRLLWVTAGFMLLVNPLMIQDVGFQLSVSATAGILYIEPWIRKKLQRSDLCNNFLAEYLYPTLAATVATLPFILWHFGRIAWISPVVNILVLPMVPLIMGMTAITLGLGLVFGALGQDMAWILYVPLAYVVWIIKLFGRA